MPLQKGKDKDGHFWQYGKAGTKYRFNPRSKRSELIAYNRAHRQAAAIKISQRMQRTYMF